MIDVRSKKNGDLIWYVSNRLETMLTPELVKFSSLESESHDKLMFVEYENDLIKVMCVPTNCTFDSKHEAEIFAVVKFMKKYHTFETSEERNEHHKLFLIASHKISEFENNFPELVVYNLMCNN
jgi:hypothetical protein